MISAKNTSPKDYEGAYLFTEFIREVNREPTPHRRDSEYTADFDSYQHRLEKENKYNYKPEQDYHSENNDYTFPDERMYRRDKYGRTMSHPSISEGYLRPEKGHMSSDENFTKRKRFMSYDPAMDEESEPSQCFICAYCEAKYVYKRCLINHLVKSHKKILKK